jgi:4-amino-4-deoxy-L-arabinose transferase-like glycosyltransferase
VTAGCAALRPLAAAERQPYAVVAGHNREDVERVEWEDTTMGDVDSIALGRRRTVRRAIGWAAAVLAVVVVVLFVLGTWNPADLIVFWRFAGNPLLGAIIVFALALIASWLIAPIGNEARQVGRTRWRIVFALALFASLIGYGLFGPRFATDYTVMAESGPRAIVLYNPGTDYQRLHVWTGSGIGRKYAGDLGKPCGFTTVTMISPDLIQVKTSYLDVRLRLDPATGRPLDRLGPTCTG